MNGCVDTKTNKLTVVGEYIPKFNEMCMIDLPCGNIFKSDGFYIHIKRRHANCLKYINKISEIILEPDYIGVHPSIPNSIEIIKIYDQNILLSIEVDINNDYLYVSSLYKINETKLQRRLNGGRIKKYT